MVVEGGISLGYTLQLIVKVDNDLTQRKIVKKLYAVAGDVVLLDEDATLAEAKGHNRADEGSLRDDGGPNEGLVDMLDEGGIGKPARIMNFGAVAFAIVDLVRYVGHGGNHIHVKFSFESLLYYLHVEESEKAAAKTKA